MLKKSLHLQFQRAPAFSLLCDIRSVLPPPPGHPHASLRRALPVPVHLHGGGCSGGLGLGSPGHQLLQPPVQEPLPELLPAPAALQPLPAPGVAASELQPALCRPAEQPQPGLGVLQTRQPGDQPGSGAPQQSQNRRLRREVRVPQSLHEGLCERAAEHPETGERPGGSEGDLPGCRLSQLMKTHFLVKKTFQRTIRANVLYST